MDVFFIYFFGLAGQYLIPLIERLICHLCFDLFIFTTIALHGCFVWQMIVFNIMVLIVLFHMEGFGGDTTHGC
jgi:hypothetical protein